MDVAHRFIDQTKGLYDKVYILCVICVVRQQEFPFLEQYSHDGRDLGSGLLNSLMYAEVHCRANFPT